MSVKMIKLCKYFANTSIEVFQYHNFIRRGLCTTIEQPSVNFKKNDLGSVVKSKFSAENNLTLEEEKNSIIDPTNEDVSHIAPYFRPTFNFAAYANKSSTLQELVKLGVDLHKLEKKKDVPDFLLRLDFEANIKQYIIFLHDLGIPADELGSYFTKNPFIFKEDLDNLQVRVNYLKSKRFTNEMITRIVRKNPSWLQFSTEEIDGRLGYFQKNFKLSGSEVRRLASNQPRLITYDLMFVKGNTFAVKEEMGFTDHEIRRLLLKAPRLWMK
ncbi:hypothetical protein L9F63_023416, partial [Diploptera punctata]